MVNEGTKWICLRQMVGLKAEYSNFKVYAVK